MSVDPAPGRNKQGNGKATHRNGSRNGHPRFREFGSLILAGFLIALASAALVWPLWKLATVHRGIYALICGLSLLALAALALVRKLRASWQAGKPRQAR